MAHQCPEGGPRASTQVQVPSETAGVGRHVKFGRTGPWLEASSARTVGRRRKTQGRAAFQGSKGEGAEDEEHERGRFGRRGIVIPAAATGASTTTSTAAPTQPALMHPPPHQVSPDSSSSRSSRSRNRSSNLNSSPSSSSSRRRPQGVGFSSQASPTSAGWLAAVGEAEADVEAPTRGGGEAVSDSLGSANRQSRQQGGRRARTSWYPVRRRREVRGTSSVHPSPGQFRRPCSTVRKRG